MPARGEGVVGVIDTSNDTEPPECGSRSSCDGARGLMALRASWAYANDLLADPNASVEDLRESVAKLTSVEKSWKRVMGPNHPELPRLQNVLRRAHVELAARTPES